MAISKSVDVLAVFVFVTGLGTNGDANFCCEVEKTEDKVKLLKIIREINKKKAKK